MTVHPAHLMSFDELWTGLQQAKAEKLVYEQTDDTGLHLFVYSESCVYDRRWNPYTIVARGIILSPDEKRIVATPFTKFFNCGERADEAIPDLPFETYEKLDGSLIIMFHHRGKWRTATKGSLRSEQAKWAAQWMAAHNLSLLDTEKTYLAEAIYPENRIVVHYPRDGLFLLGAYRQDGTEVGYDDLQALAITLDWPIAKRHAYSTVSELLAIAKTLPSSEEGFVLRFSNGLRLKIKGEEYRRIHAMVSRLTPLAIWESMLAGDDLEDLRRKLPEEFWLDFDSIRGTLQKNVDDVLARVADHAARLSHLSDKEVGLQLSALPENVRRFIFAYRKNNGDILTGRTRDLLFRSFRPDANVLPGYTPSFAMNRVMAESG